MTHSQQACVVNVSVRAVDEHRQAMDTDVCLLAILDTGEQHLAIAAAAAIEAFCFRSIVHGSPFLNMVLGSQFPGRVDL